MLKRLAERARAARAQMRRAPERAGGWGALWAPVAIGLGVQIWFMAPVEPPGWSAAAALAAAGAALVALRRRRGGVAAAALLLVALGFGAATLRARIVAAPKLDAPLTAVIEGRIRAVERSSAGRPRLALDRVWVFGVAAEAQPRRALLSLLSEADAEGLAPGDRVSALARLGPPGGPVEPGAFDYARAAWFDGIGAVGAARGPPAFATAPSPEGTFGRLSVALDEARKRLADALRARLDGQAGAVAAALATGDRYGMAPETVAALRDSGLAHLLAISGLHMAIASGLVFLVVRQALAFTPFAAGRWRIKAVAAAAALAAGAAYLALSGGSVATQRAFLMAAVALGAAMLDRPAITMRALALAATLILLVRPESLISVGFQMSFAATAALIAVYEAARDALPVERRRKSWARAAARWAGAIAATSVIAGAATAPFAAFHFNRLAAFGLIANLAAVPVMTAAVAPALGLSVALAPFGFEAPALAVAEAGIDAILAVARWTAGLDGAVRSVPAATPAALWALTAGGALLCIGRGAPRAAGAAVVSAALAFWTAGSERPALLIAPRGSVVGALGPEGRSLDRAPARSYAAETWLRRDGDPATLAEAAARPGFAREGDWFDATAAPVSVTRARRPDGDGFRSRCAAGRVVIAPRASLRAPDACFALDRESLSEALAIRWRDGAPILERVEASRGSRFWAK